MKRLFIFITVKQWWKNTNKLEKASTHKSAKTHTGNVFVTRDVALFTFDLKISEFSGLFLEHAKFDDRRCIGFFRDIVPKNRQTHRQTEVKNLPPPASAVGVANK